MDAEKNTLRPQAQRLAYRSGDPFWWCNLAAVYATDEPVDLSRARKWYERSAKAGYIRAKFELAVMLLQGEGGKTELARGRQLLESAARAGEPDAVKVLSHAREERLWRYR